MSRSKDAIQRYRAVELSLEAAIAQNLEGLIKQFTRLLEETQVEIDII
jgi:hypothetical protein